MLTTNHSNSDTPTLATWYTLQEHTQDFSNIVSRLSNEL